MIKVTLFSQLEKDIFLQMHLFSVSHFKFDDLFINS